MKAPQISDAALASGIREGENYSTLARKHGLTRHMVRRRMQALPNVPRAPMGRPRADVDMALVAEMRTDGLTLDQIGARLGVSEGTIRLRLKASRRAA